MTRRMRRRDSFRRITKAKSEEFARDMKKKYEEGSKDVMSLIYCTKNKSYTLVNSVVDYIGKTDKRLVGNVSWEEVKRKTGRDSILAGGDYIRGWIDLKEVGEETEDLGQEIKTKIKVNGEYVDTPFRTSDIE